MSQDTIKFAYWVPNVSGGLVVSKIEQRTDWGIDYNRKLAQIAEAAGFDYALSQVRFTAGYGAEYQHESVAFSHALLAATTRLKVIAAVLPGPWTPSVLAKQIATIDHLTGGRVAVNIVSGWFKGEFTAIGEPWLEHDERYRRSEEFITALKGIWTTDNFTLRGDFYRFHDYTLKPKPLQQHPEIFQGGSSRAARDMAARVSDWYFTNGNTVEGVKAQIDDLQAKAAANNHKVKVGVNAFVIARDTEEEARAVLAQIIDQADPEAVQCLRRCGETGRQIKPGRRGQLGQVQLRGPGAVQRWLQDQPDRHTAADRRTHRRAQGRGCGSGARRLSALPGRSRVFRPQGAAAGA